MSTNYSGPMMAAVRRAAEEGGRHRSHRAINDDDEHTSTGGGGGGEERHVHIVTSYDTREPLNDSKTRLIDHSHHHHPHHHHSHQQPRHQSYQSFKSLHGSHSSPSLPLLHEERRVPHGSRSERLHGSSKRNFIVLPVWHPKRKLFRYAILFVACLFSIGSYFAHDCIAVVQQDIQNAFNIDASQFGLLYSVYNIPNIVLPFVGGYLLDKVGLPTGTLVCVLLVAIGAAMVLTSAYVNSFALMVAGRFLFGMGAETSYVAQNTICCLWFNEKELALAMAMTVSAGRLGSFFTFSANAYVVGVFHDYRAALWLGAIAGALALMAGIFYLFLHKLAETINKTMFTPDETETEELTWRAIFKFPATFWLASLAALAFYGSIFPFQSTATTFIQNLYHFPQSHAAFVVSILPLTSLFLSPICGWFVDKFAMRAFIVLLSFLIIVPAFVALFYPFKYQPIISMLMLGLSFSTLPAALWPAFSILLPEEYMGTGFGLISGATNGAMALVYWGQGRVTNPTYLIAMYVLITIVGIAAAALWNLKDLFEGGTVNSRHPHPHTSKTYITT
eukprot:TRINITY_DN17217_c0_g1_i2.p1 TRINITY_DN17217_c0_g1~~TRINITY_DN17217_c0_g1_i2.p1  ORF type:complete len:586 (-),score=99.11 TRINITY_DN17217_c0_g1_i2:122-1804(-)